MDHRKAMVALCLQAGLGSWKEVREVRDAPGRTELSALQQLCIFEQPSLGHEAPHAASSEDVLRLAAMGGGRRAASLDHAHNHRHACGRHRRHGARRGPGPRRLSTTHGSLPCQLCSIGNVGLMALAPALQRS